MAIIKPIKKAVKRTVNKVQDTLGAPLRKTAEIYQREKRAQQNIKTDLATRKTITTKNPYYPGTADGKKVKAIDKRLKSRKNYY